MAEGEEERKGGEESICRMRRGVREKKWEGGGKAASESGRVIYRLTIPARLVINYVVLLLYIKIAGR